MPSWFGPRDLVVRGMFPVPSCPRAVCERCWGWGAPSSASLSWARLHRGVPCWCDWGSPPCPRCAPWARAAGWGVPSPLTPLDAARVKRVQPFGGGPRLCRSAIGLLRSERVLGAPLWFRFPFAWGGPVLQCSGSPPLPSLRAVGARFWVGVPPPSYSPRRPLALGVRNRSGGPLSSVYPPSGSCAELARLGFLSPSSYQVRTALWFMPPRPSSPAAGPALAGPLSDASDTTLSYSQRGCLPFSVVAPSALSNCSGGYPAPPSPAAVSIASSGAAILPRRAAPSPPSGPCLLVARVVGGFSSLPPSPRPSYPRR